jgi:hypothetical protein
LDLYLWYIETGKILKWNKNHKPMTPFAFILSISNILTYYIPFRWN